MPRGERVESAGVPRGAAAEVAPIISVTASFRLKGIAECRCNTRDRLAIPLIRLTLPQTCEEGLEVDQLFLEQSGLEAAPGIFIK